MNIGLKKYYFGMGLSLSGIIIGIYDINFTDSNILGAISVFLILGGIILSVKTAYTKQQNKPEVSQE